jgi:recombination protein RecA
MNIEEKIKTREDLLKKLNKDHGKGIIGVYSDMPKIDVKTVSSGSLGLDVALGVGGWARGRIVETYGDFSSGKTTLALHAIAEAQKTGGLAAFIDAEHSLDPSYAQNLGVDMDNLVLSQPDNGEQALNIVKELVESNAFDIVVIDSVSALTPKKEIDGEIGDFHVGAQARMMSQALRKLAGPVHTSKTTLVFINQTRQKIGVMFGNPETTSGGTALKFYASQRVEVKKLKGQKKEDEVISTRTRCKVVKNKVGAPFKECEFDIVFGKGINHTGEVFDAAVALSIFDKSGSWYSYEGNNIGQGREGCIDWLNANSDKYDAIEGMVRKELGLTKD